MPICLPLHHNKEKKQQKTKKSKHNNWRKPEFNCMFEKKSTHTLIYVKYSYMPKWSLTYHTYNMDKDTLWRMNHNLFYSRRKKIQQNASEQTKDD